VVAPRAGDRGEARRSARSSKGVRRRAVLNLLTAKRTLASIYGVLRTPRSLSGDGEEYGASTEPRRPIDALDDADVALFSLVYICAHNGSKTDTISITHKYTVK